MPHTVLVEVPCLEGKAAELLQVLLPALVDTRAFKGCELVEAYIGADNPDLVVLWEKWATQADQEAYLAWRAETGVDLIGPFKAGDPRFVHLMAAD
jgi:quinol monooxygenase YgiN